MPVTATPTLRPVPADLLLRQRAAARRRVAQRADSPSWSLGAHAQRHAQAPLAVARR